MKSLNRKRLTQQGVDRIRHDKAAAPPSGRIEIEDEACPGLLLRITPRNVKSFSVIFRVVGEGGTSLRGRLLMGTQHRITLGSTPPLSLTDARRQAREIIQAATEGRDLRVERRQSNLIRAVNTFEAVFAKFMEIEIKHAKDRAHFGPMRAQILSPEGLAAMLYDLQRRDVSNWNPEDIPKTGARVEQIRRSLTGVDQFFSNWLESGDVFDPRNEIELEFRAKAHSSKRLSAGHTRTLRNLPGPGGFCVLGWPC